jgi:hypothetical protein
MFDEHFVRVRWVDPGGKKKLQIPRDDILGRLGTHTSMVNTQ